MVNGAQPSDICEPRPPAGRAAAWMQILTVLLVALFLGFSFLFDAQCRLRAPGRVRFFVASYYVWLSPAAAVALLAMCAIRLRAHLDGYVSGELDEEAKVWQVPLSACVVIVVIPIVLALAVNPTRYSAGGLRKRRVERPPRDAAFDATVDWVLGLRTVPRRASSIPKKPTVLDLVNAAYEGQQKALDGQRITLFGQCDPPYGPDSERFDLYRLVVTCCVADATSVSVEIVREPGVSLEAGKWVEVAGTVRFGTGADPSVPVIRAETVRNIPEPSEPYL